MKLNSSGASFGTNISFVIICKNEGKYISLSIEAALRESAAQGDSEVILVDSCSTDDTVSIASRYPVTILQLRPEWWHTPAAGRLIGFRESRGEYIVFIDGDSILQNGFMERALTQFKKNPQAAAIHGRRHEIYWKHDVQVGEERDFTRVGSLIRPVSAATGTAIFRREALEKAGCFNPFLYAWEEAELGERLRWSGHELFAIPVDMIVHHTVPRENMAFWFRRIKNNMNLGLGQVIRYRLSQKQPVGTFLEIGMRALQFTVWILFGGVAVAGSMKTGHWIYGGVWFLLSLLLVLAFMIKSRSLSKPFRYSMIWAIQAYTLVQGFLIEPRDPCKYPSDVIVLKKAS